MKRILLIGLPILVVIFYMTQFGSSDDDYIREIEEFREDKHVFFKTSSISPFVEQGIEYEPVIFYKPNPDYKVNAKLEKLTSRETIAIPNSDGSQTRYLKFAFAKFQLGGQSHALLILKALGFGNQYLTAFADETSALTTYGGGRYLDVVIGKSDQVELDFNKAYNPYCAYSSAYLCPLPPRENFLAIAIEAGEKDYQPSTDSN